MNSFPYSVVFHVLAMLGILSSAGAQERMSLSVEKGRLTAQVKDSPIRLFLEQVALRAQVTIDLSEEIGDNSVSVEVTGVPLDEALRAVLSGYDTFFYYQAADGATLSLRSVWVYPKGAAAALRPVPPQVWAGAKELAASLADSDPNVRERAYQALMERPDDRSRDYVVQALRGREKDEPMRQRIFSDALSKGVEVPSDVLAELARADQSEQIRWMALDTLAPHPSARQVAEALLTDPSEAVRQRAAEIIAELTAAAHRVERAPEPQP
jgi:hypothetical protein